MAKVVVNIIVIPYSTEQDTQERMLTWGTHHFSSQLVTKEFSLLSACFFPKLSWT